VVLMDVRMPVLDGLEATRHICSDANLARTRGLVLTTFDREERSSAGFSRCAARDRASSDRGSSTMTHQPPRHWRSRTACGALASPVVEIVS
jgi:CheY-like chemotaxis protein